MTYKTEILLDGRKQIFYEPSLVGRQHGFLSICMETFS